MVDLPSLRGLPPRLPAVIGPTENALRALSHRLLAQTSIRSYERWVVLNMIAGSAASRDEVRRALVDALQVDPTRVDSILTDLASEGWISEAHDRLLVSPDGAAMLDRARSHVTEVTARLTHSASPGAIDVALHVLDTLRSSAERELATLG